MGGESTIRAEARWVEGLQFVGRGLGSGGSLLVAGSSGSDGQVCGIRPMEALLASLASCSGMDVISILQKMKQRVTGFRVEAEGQRADEHPRRYEQITLTYVVRGHEIQEAKVVRAIELSLEKYCGVTGSLNAEIRSAYRIASDER